MVETRLHITANILSCLYNHVLKILVWNLNVHIVIIRVIIDLVGVLNSSDLSGYTHILTTTTLVSR